MKFSISNGNGIDNNHLYHYSVYQSRELPKVYFIWQKYCKYFKRRSSAMNVILVIFDSLREDCVECLGTPPWGKVFTPNLDRFAEESFVLKRCFPESLPTLQARRAIYTGKRVYPFEKDPKYKGDTVLFAGWGPISEERDTISEILQENGYYTALISDIHHQFKPSKNFHRGFDEWLWIRGYEFDKYRSGPIPKKKEIDYWLPKELQTELRISRLGQALMNMQGKIKEEDYFVANVMRESVRWLEQNTDKENKFLLVEAWSPHEPWFVPQHYRNLYYDDHSQQQVLSLYSDLPDINMSPEILKITQANYSALVTMCDRWFGYLYDSIANMGMLDDTLIVVTTDHGHSIGDYDYIGKRGYPSTPEVYNIPVFIRHPDDKLGRGISSDILVQHTDITATIMDIIDVDSKKGKRNMELFGMMQDDAKPEGEKSFNQASGSSQTAPRPKPGALDMDGKSFFNALLNKEKGFRDHVTVGWGAAVTVITDDWWFNCRVNGRGPFLYNLKRENPFGENVADSHPDVLKGLFDLALKDAGGKFPDYLIATADTEKDMPGCSDLAMGL